jgi:protein-S-isoprenylcysteine O-methyltransferase Ste14
MERQAVSERASSCAAGREAQAGAESGAEGANEQGAAGAEPGAVRILWTWRDALRIPLRPEIYRMLLFIYVPVLIPLTIGLVALGNWIDRLLGWGFLPAPPWNVILFVPLFVSGVVIVWWSLSYIVIVGGGSPAPLVGPPASRLVLGGAYSLCRHPSVIGKLLGVVGVALLFRSNFYFAVIIPLLLTGSLLEKKLRMEKGDVGHWGRVYHEYQRSVPFLIPRWRDLKRFVREKHYLREMVLALPPAEDDHDAAS